MVKNWKSQICSGIWRLYKYVFLKALLFHLQEFTMVDMIRAKVIYIPKYILLGLFFILFSVIKGILVVVFMLLIQLLEKFVVLLQESLAMVMDVLDRRY
jgi:hypothetical protein